ncbi:helix-turn-helix domain-containing protein [Streptomyces specialis]|uniref:helix-turn-helix domain-containing protein n=1 Tax=Streptomyces specialis TaxID=498367 RepID=UPI00099E1A73|nr:helix-turn-helix transcriptional regulator [Streptomyces specialis]
MPARPDRRDSTLPAPLPPAGGLPAEAGPGMPPATAAPDRTPAPAGPQETDPVEEAAALFVRELVRLRTGRGWSQRQTAARMGYHRSYVCHIENGNEGPTESFAKAADKALGSGHTLTALWRVYDTARIAARGDAPAPLASGTTDSRPEPAPHPPAEPERPPAGQAVSGSSISAGVVQIRGAGGSVRIVHRDTPASPAVLPPALAGDVPVDAEEGGQAVLGSAVAGPVYHCLLYQNGAAA